MSDINDFYDPCLREVRFGVLWQRIYYHNAKNGIFWNSSEVGDCKINFFFPLFRKINSQFSQVLNFPTFPENKLSIFFQLKKIDL